SSFAKRPAAMVPWADDKEILILPVMFFQQFIDLERPVVILLIPPTSYVQRGNCDRFDVRLKGLLLPELVVIGMGDEIIPGRQLALEMLGVGVAQRAKPEIPIECVRPVELETEVGLRRLHHGDVLKSVAEPKCAVVVEIITKEHVGGGRLRGYCLE